MELITLAIEKPAEVNIIFGQSHFIRTVEDLHEAVASSAPNAQFGVAFCEASGPRLVRHSGTDPEMEALAARNMLAIGAGHCFLITLANLFPIHVLRAVREVPELCRIFCATANPVQVILAQTEQGRGVLGVIDGGASLGIETEEDIEQRKRFLRNIGLKA
ncbi:MAG: adenosine-specific kinase [Myxococcota bacterium]|jgi:adenosine/AMP kinase|nr:adenosine-specific kinase [Myxococcota bacterium]